MTAFSMIVRVIFYLILPFSIHAFDWHLSSRPEVTKQAIAGLWKFKPVVSQFPKEFTTYPKKRNEIPELLLMLKEDGSFQQYNTETDVDEAWTSFQKQKQVELAVSRGVWDYVDGKLILAADRDKKTSKDDTLLEGMVKVTYESSLQENPVVDETLSKDNSTQHVDAHLSVPRGAVKVGKFFYPKQHPAFFEQPMFQPMPKGVFQLQQVLGALNAFGKKEQEDIEKFQEKDFHDRTFLLTSSPLGKRDNTSAPVRVMQVQFHKNNTFSTVAGLGESILRGKYSIMGQDKDQLYMRVSRFGFGRSVSGSVYSEGRMLSQDDCKTYWGTISYGTNVTSATESSRDQGETVETTPQLEVTGSVLFGSGLEPMPVGRFIMKELQESDIELLDDEDEEDDEYDPSKALDALLGEDYSFNEGIDDSFGEGFE